MAKERGDDTLPDETIFNKDTEHTPIDISGEPGGRGINRNLSPSLVALANKRTGASPNIGTGTSPNEAAASNGQDSADEFSTPQADALDSRDPFETDPPWAQETAAPRTDTSPKAGSEESAKEAPAASATPTASKSAGGRLSILILTLVISTVIVIALVAYVQQLAGKIAALEDTLAVTEGAPPLEVMPLKKTGDEGGAAAPAFGSATPPLSNPLSQGQAEDHTLAETVDELSESSEALSQMIDSALANLVDRIASVENRLADNDQTQTLQAVSQRLSQLERSGQNVGKNKEVAELRARLQSLERQISANRAPVPTVAPVAPQPTVKTYSSDPAEQLKTLPLTQTTSAGPIDNASGAVAAEATSQRPAQGLPPFKPAPAPPTVSNSNNTDSATTETAASTAPAATSAPKSAPGSSDDWFINLGTYSDLTAAERLLAKIQPSVDSAQIETVTIDGRPLYRIRSSGYASRKAAETKAEQMQAMLGLSGLWIDKK